jgi:hypothetical protein
VHLQLQIPSEWYRVIIEGKKSVFAGRGMGAGG